VGTGVDPDVKGVWMVATWITPGVAGAQVRVPEGGEVRLEAPADAGRWAWDFDGDGVFDDCEGERECLFSARTFDGPDAVDVGVWADGVVTTETISVDNVAPVIVSPPPVTVRRGAEYRYEPIVEDPVGERDPYAVVLVEDESPAGMWVEEGVLVWIPDDADLAMTPVRVRVEVADGDGGTASQVWDVNVRDNSGPSVPLPLYPTSANCVMVARPTLKVGNASDPDGDPLLYFVEVDSDPDFDSAQLVQSPGLPEGPSGFTEWQLQGLPFGARFYWRVWASDGAEESAKAGETFVYCGGPTGPPAADDNDPRPRPELLPPLPPPPDELDAPLETADGGCLGPTPEPVEAGIGAAGLLAVFVCRRKRTLRSRPGSDRT